MKLAEKVRTDLLLAESERQKIIEARRDIEEKLSDQESALNVLMNRDPFSPLARPVVNSEQSRPPSPEEDDHNWSRATEVRQAQQKCGGQSKARIGQAHLDPDPTVSLDAQRYNAASQVVSQVGGGVSINIPWFNGKKYRAAEREAQGELSAAESDFVSAQTESLGLLRNQLEKIETTHHHLELYSENLLPTAHQFSDVYRNR